MGMTHGYVSWVCPASLGMSSDNTGARVVVGGWVFWDMQEQPEAAYPESVLGMSSIAHVQPDRARHDPRQHSESKPRPSCMWLRTSNIYPLFRV